MGQSVIFSCPPLKVGDLKTVPPASRNDHLRAGMHALVARKGRVSDISAPGNRKRRKMVHESSTALRVSTLQNTATGNTSAAELVDKLLESIKGTDSGEELDKTKREAIDSLILQLQALGEHQRPRPLDSDLIWGNYNVSYVSTQKAPKQQGQPAGGIFRSGPAKLVFRTTLLAQSILKPDLVTNKVGFKLLGFMPGFVGLRGRLQPVEGNQDTVRVDFEPAEICIAGDSLQLGRSSDVTLKTTYLDSRIRLGQGSRGSLFVFTRGGASDSAGMEQVGVIRPLQAASLGIKLRNAFAAAALAFVAFQTWQQGGLALQLLSAAAAATMLLILKRFI